MSAHGAASPVAWDRGGGGVLAAGPLRRLAAGTRAMALAELRKLRHDHVDVFTRSVQPLLWLRQMLIGVGTRGLLWFDFLVVIAFFAAMLAAATRAYPRAIL